MRKIPRQAGNGKVKIENRDTMNIVINTLELEKRVDN